MLYIFTHTSTSVFPCSINNCHNGAVQTDTRTMYFSHRVEVITGNGSEFLPHTYRDTISPDDIVFEQLFGAMFSFDAKPKTILTLYLHKVICKL